MSHDIYKYAKETFLINRRSLLQELLCAMEVTISGAEPAGLVEHTYRVKK